MPPKIVQLGSFYLVKDEFDCYKWHVYDLDGYEIDWNKTFQDGITQGLIKK